MPADSPNDAKAHEEKHLVYSDPVPRTSRSLFLAMIFAAGGLVVAGFIPVSNHDTFGHLAAGRQIVEQGSVPQVDSLSFFQETPQAWTNYEWLNDLMVFVIYDRAGWDGLLAFKLIMLALIGGLLVRKAWSTSGDHGAAICAALIVVAIPAIRFRLSVRPHILGIAFASAFLLGLPKVGRAGLDRRTRLETWAWTAGLVGAHLVWVNLHGSNLFGLTMTGIYLVTCLKERVAARRLAVLLALQLLVSCISPYGPAILVDSIRHVFDPEFRELVLEWAPWDPNCPLWWLLAPVIQTIALAVAAVPLTRRGRNGTALLLIGLCLSVMAFRSIRFMAEFLLLSAPVVAVGLSNSGWFEWARRRPRVAQYTAYVCASLFAVIGANELVRPMPLGHGVSTRHLPEASAELLVREAPDARILAALEDSWYLMFAVPRATFLVDGRVPFYGTQHIKMVQRAFGSPEELHRTLDRFGVDTMVVEHVDPGQQVVLGAMRDHPAWTAVVIEDHYVTYLRNTGERSRLAERQALRVLAPAYEADFVLGVDVDLAKVRQERSRLPDHPNTTAYRAWIDGLLAIRPIAEDGGRSGLRAPMKGGEGELLARARQLFDVVGSRLDDVPTVGVYKAMTAVADCDLEGASEILEKLERSGGFRETLLLRQEIALRQGRFDDVRDFLRQVRAVESMSADPWIEALDHRLDQPPRCPQ